MGESHTVYLLYGCKITKKRYLEIYPLDEELDMLRGSYYKFDIMTIFNDSSYSYINDEVIYFAPNSSVFWADANDPKKISDYIDIIIDHQNHEKFIENMKKLHFTDEDLQSSWYIVMFKS